MSNSGFVKGLAAGMALGATVAIIIDPISDRQKNKIVKKSEGVFKSIGSMIDSCMNIFS